MEQQERMKAPESIARSGRSRKPFRALTPYLLVLPALTYLLFFWGYPTLYAFVLSLTDASIGRESARFVGAANYLFLFRDPVFGVALRNTGILATGSVLLEVSVGLLVSLVLFRAGRRTRGFLITVLLVPWLFPPLVSALTWRWIFHEPFGLLNQALHALGATGIPWLARPWTAMGAILLASLWQGAGISALVILAALRMIPSNLLDLSLTDGAAGWKRFRHVLLPQIRGVLLLDCLLVAIKSLGAFTLVFALTGGGPGTSTEILASYVYRLNFFQYEPGKASAAGILLAFLFLVLVCLVFLQRQAGSMLRQGEAS
jgi:multiple sugar transport system permease protein